jgi:dolichol-phosphate mannosyltransferase
LIGIEVIRKFTVYIRSNWIHIRRFIFAGGIAAAFNLGLMFVFVEWLGFRTRALQNIANFVSMEAAILLNFFLSRHYTWADAKRHHGVRLLSQIVGFHLAVGVGLVLRAVMFPLLQLLKVTYILNVVFGIASAAGVNFIGYNHIVFRKEA